MSKITNLIFNGAEHYITSGFGSREPIKTYAGTSSNVHNGTDYGTYGKKIPQYAIEDGYVYSVGTDNAGAKYVTIVYPRINKRFLHWHLDTINVSKNQNVKKGTYIGNTGMTGMATGVHLHLGIIDLNTNSYINPETYNYTEPSIVNIQGDTHQLALDVIAGKYGNGEQRKQLLGSRYAEVQKEVNNILYGKSNKKSVDELAREVIRGDWGNGEERKTRLTSAGYNYYDVQKRVNQMLGY